MCVTNILFIINESDSQISLLLHAPGLINKAEPSDWVLHSGRQAGRQLKSPDLQSENLYQGGGKGGWAPWTKTTKPTNHMRQAAMGEWEFT